MACYINDSLTSSSNSKRSITHGSRSCSTDTEGKNRVSPTSVNRRIGDITECPICREPYENPRSLPCIHTYCLKCLETLCADSEAGDVVKCPLCRKEFPIPDDGLCHLPRNVFVEKLLEVQKLCDAQAASGRRCDACSGMDDTATGAASSAVGDPGRPVKSFCMDCRQNYCDPCTHAHRNITATTRHTLVQLGNRAQIEGMMGSMPPDECTKHPDRKTELYCSDCKSVICVICSIESHHHHRCCHVRKVAADFSERIRTDADDLSTAIDRCRELFRGLVTDAKDFDARINEIQKDVDDEAERMHLMIVVQRNAAAERLDHIRKTRLDDLKRLRQDVESHLSALENVRLFCTELSRKGTSSEIAGIANYLHDRTLELIGFDISGQIEANNKPVEVNFTPTQLISPDDSKTVGVVDVNSSFKADIKPKLVHATDRSMAGVTGLAKVGSKLYVTRERSLDIHVYNVADFSNSPKIPVSGLSTWPRGLAACSTRNCLYVSDCNKHCVFRVSLQQPQGSRQQKWTVARRPTGLSVNSSTNLLVISVTERKIQQFNHDGYIISVCNLPDAVGHPVQAIEFSKNELLVSHYGVNHCVTVLGIDGRIIKSYGGMKGLGCSQLNRPRGLATDFGGCVYVADRENDRIMVLDQLMTRAVRLCVPLEKALKEPSVLCVDASRDLLFIGERRAGRITVLSLRDEQTE